MFPPTIPFLASTRAQNWLAAAVLGAAPGIYLAITGLGAGGGMSNSAKFSQIQNALGNGLFGLFSFFMPIVLRYVNVRWFLILGPTGYAVYIAGLMYFQARDEMALPLVLTIWQGVGGAFVWVGTTYISMAYSTSATRGRFINNQWVGVALGSVVGAAVAFGANIHKSKAAGVSYGVLGGWLAIHVTASICAFFVVLPSNRVVAEDGHVIPTGHDILGDMTPMQTLKDIVRTFCGPKVLLAALAMFSSDFWLVFVGAFNARNFSLRARSLNTFLYWFMQIPTAFALSYLLDRPGWSQRKRGMAGFTLLVTMVCGSWFGYYLWQGLHPASANPLNKIEVIDWADGGHYVGGMFVYLIFGLSYPVYHVVLVFYFSMLGSEGSRKMTYYSGIFKGLQGTGLCLAFGVNAIKGANMMTMAICYGAVAAVSLVPLGYAFWKYLDDGTGVIAEPETPSSIMDEKGIEEKGVVSERIVREEKV